MSDDRERVMGRIREALARVEARAPRPAYPDGLPTARNRAGTDAPLEAFRRHFEAAAGHWLAGIGDLPALLSDHGAHRVYCDPRLPGPLSDALAGAGLEIVGNFDRDAADGIDAAVTPATGAVAETGSLVLTDADTSDRLAAVAPWIHVAVLDPGSIAATLVEALSSLPDDPNVVLVTGPSQTADVEGILIRGVHGPGIQACLPMAWRTPGEES